MHYCRDEDDLLQHLLRRSSGVDDKSSGFRSITCDSEPETREDWPVMLNMKVGLCGWASRYDGVSVVTVM